MLLLLGVEVGGSDHHVLEVVIVAKKAADGAESARPKKKKASAKASKKPPETSGQPDALLGKRFTHRKRAEWGIGTVVDGAENALLLSWSDGVERRTARTYMDQLVEVP
jgi:hypothetical protein